jgi:hypothetical protein
MAAIMTDADTTQAVAALTHRIRTRDAAIRGGDETAADAEVFAREFLTAMLGRGWRVTPARIYPAWGTAPPGAGAKPPRDLLDEARERCDAATAAIQAREIEDGAA